MILYAILPELINLTKLTDFLGFKINPLPVSDDKIRTQLNKALHKIKINKSNILIFTRKEDAVKFSNHYIFGNSDRGDEYESKFPIITIYANRNKAHHIEKSTNIKSDYPMLQIISKNNIKSTADVISINKEHKEIIISKVTSAVINKISLTLFPKNFFYLDSREIEHVISIEVNNITVYIANKYYLKYSRQLSCSTYADIINSSKDKESSFILRKSVNENRLFFFNDVKNELNRFSNKNKNDFYGMVLAIFHQMASSEKQMLSDALSIYCQILINLSEIIINYLDEYEEICQPPLFSLDIRKK